jgi:hypothetical protein
VLIAAVMLLPAATVEAQDDPGDDPPQPVVGGLEPRTPIPAADFYGINFVAPFEPWASLAVESGAGTVRWQFNWRDIETNPGVYEWGTTDAHIAAWISAGLRIHALLHNPPDFAKVNPGSGLVPTNLNLPWNDPANGWAQYCYRFASRYRGQIASYEIWNEPDLNQYWEGTPQEYFYAMKGCYLAIKAADPNSTVAMAGMAILVERNFMPEVMRLAAVDPQGPANNYFFDVANIHMYADPDLVYSLTTYTRRFLNTYGMSDKPIWITETNVALRGAGRVPDVPDWGHASEDEQGWYVVQAAANAFAGGAQRLMFFRLADDDMDEAFGLIRNDRSLRPSYRSLQLASSLMRDIVAARREVRQGVIITYMERADGARIVVLYSKTGTGLNLEIEARQAAAVLINAAGGYSTVEAENGVYTVTLPTARGRNFSRLHDYAVGGPPVIVVEQDTEPPLASAQIIPIPGDQGHVIVRWESDDGPYGTGAAAYDVQVSVNDGPWEDWGSGVADLQVVYDISEGGTFAFRVRAMDRAGNLGEYSEPVATSLIPVGTLVITVTDLRDQLIPFARVALSDGTLHDADDSGVVTITTEPGLVRVVSIDGSAQGRLEPSEPFEIELAEQSSAAWMLLPLQDLIANGQFEFGAQGWAWSSPHDVFMPRLADPARGSVLRIQGARRPWGAPAAATTLDVPEGWTGALLSFSYRMAEDGPILRIRAVTDSGQEVIWRSGQPRDDFQRTWVDLSAYEGQRVTLRFELSSVKGGTPGWAEIDDVIVGNVPVLPQP